MIEVLAMVTCANNKLKLCDFHCYCTSANISEVVRKKEKKISKLNNNNSNNNEKKKINVYKWP